MSTIYVNKLWSASKSKKRDQNITFFTTIEHTILVPFTTNLPWKQFPKSMQLGIFSRFWSKLAAKCDCFCPLCGRLFSSWKFMEVYKVVTIVNTKAAKGSDTTEQQSCPRARIGSELWKTLWELIYIAVDTPIYDGELVAVILSAILLLLLLAKVI